MEVSVSFTSRTLYPQGKNPWYPLDRRLGGPQSRSGRGGEEKNSQPLPELEPSIIQAVAQRYTAELSRLLISPYPHPIPSTSVSMLCFHMLLICQVVSPSRFWTLFLFLPSKRHVQPILKSLLSLS
jgi:hypothetical protein